ncbi:MAG: UDP-N-acetylmuramoyl-tripeptide--D-alanyl-D-alanine ligase [Chitinophagaceae bacterium]|nr:UDP-N-acetylmuramoyl-tripeptide--D-alanyl-D-alanine ligase [Chitinophagaceae bacterium]
MTTEKLYSLYLQHPQVQTDTRKLKEGEIFFALKGPNFNANSFAAQALQTGAAYVVVDEETGITDTRIIKTGDVLTALQQLALHHRKQFKIPFLAVTGSNGKTTTKELIHAVLSTTYTTYTTQGNLNNHIGIPLTLLSIKKDAELAVIEMGANHQKEIEGYCKIALPTHGIITNCGKAHLEGFGRIEGVRKGKGELYDFLRMNNGTAFVMNDYDYLREMSKNIPHVITYGTSGAALTGVTAESEPFLKVKITGGADIDTITTQLVGDYNLPNVLAAATVGHYFKVTSPQIKAAIENYVPSNSRSQLIEKGSYKIILDAYNANPSSMKAAIENFARQHYTNKTLLLGGMMELGDESIKEHESVIGLIDQYKWKDVVLVGGNFKHTAHSYHYFDNAAEAKNWLSRQQLHNGAFLIKGSRSMKMEELVTAFDAK